MILSLYKDKITPLVPFTMNSNLPSYIPISDVLRLVTYCKECSLVGDSPEFILDSAISSGVMPETRQLIYESERMIQIKTEIGGDISQKILSREKWGEIRALLMSETIIVGYDENDEKIYGKNFLDCTWHESVHPDMIIKKRLNLVDRFKDDYEGPIETMLELVVEHQEEEEQKEFLDRQKVIKKENIRMCLLTTDQPQNITVKKVDGLYVVQNSFKFVLDPPKERIVVGIYNPDKTIRTKLSDEEIQTCTLLKLKIIKDEPVEKVTVEDDGDDEKEHIVQEKIVVEEKAEPSDDDLSPFGSPAHSSIPPHPILFTKTYHKYVSYLNILSLLYNTDDGLDEEVWTDDLINRVDARLYGTEIGPGSSARKIETLRNMGTSYDTVYITSKNQPNKRPYKISSDHTLTDILEGTRVFAGKNTVIDYFDVDEAGTTNSVLSLVVNWLN